MAGHDHASDSERTSDNDAPRRATAPAKEADATSAEEKTPVSIPPTLMLTKPPALMSTPGEASTSGFGPSSLQSSAGNLAVQRAAVFEAYRRRQHVQARTSASLVQRCGDHSCPSTGCGGHETDDTKAEDTLFRSASGVPSRSIQSAHDLVRRPGHELPGAVARELSMILGHDFSGVRVHHDAQAAASAAYYAASAYTVGSHIVFGANRYQPDTESGRRLLAHELTHVVQASRSNGMAAGISSPSDASEQEASRIAATNGWADGGHAGISAAPSAAVQRDADPWTLPAQPAPRAVSPSVVQGDVKIGSVEEAAKLFGLPPESIPPGALENPDFLVSIAAHTPGGSAARLEEMLGVPEDVVAALPDGKVSEVDEAMLRGLTSEDEETGGGIPVHEIHGGVHGAEEAMAHGLIHHGFASAGPNAIGIVAFPQSRLVRRFFGGNQAAPGPLFPESKVLFGHTAVYVRIDNKITLIRSYAPASYAEAAMNISKVRAGTGGVPAQIVDHVGNPYGGGGSMFDITSGQSVEYAVDRKLAEDFAKSLPEGGELPGQLYTAQPEVAEALGKARLINGRNCVHWAVEQVEGALGARVGPGGSLMDAGGGDAARQGKVHDFITRGLKGEKVGTVRTPDGKTITPKFGEMPGRVRVFKTAGRVFGVFSYGLSAIRVVTSDVEHLPGVVVEEFLGHAGGELGAEFGTELCVVLGVETGGLGLLVCGIAGGVGGAHAAGWVGEKIGGFIDAVVMSPVAMIYAIETLAEFADEFGPVLKAIGGINPLTMAPNNLIEKRSRLDPANWDLRWSWMPSELQPDLRAIGAAIWQRIAGLDLNGLLKMANAPLSSFGVPGDAVGRLARGISEIARKQNINDLVITPEALLAMPLSNFATIIDRWGVTFVRDPAYNLAGFRNRADNEGELHFRLEPLIAERNAINPANWDLSAVRTPSEEVNGRDIDLQASIEKVGTTVWAWLGRLPEQQFADTKDQPLPAFGVSADMLEDVAEGYTATHEYLATTPEELRQLSPEGFVGFLIDFKTGFQFKEDPHRAAEIAVRWVRAGFQPW